MNSNKMDAFRQPVYQLQCRIVNQAIYQTVALSCVASIWLVLMTTARAIATSDQDLLKSIRSAKIIKDDVPLTVKLAVPEAIVFTTEKQSTQPKDYKIDAILFARAIMGVDGKEISRVKTRFDSGNKSGAYKEVTITAGDIKAYGTGKLNIDTLLSSIEIREESTAASGDSASKVAKGSLETLTKEERRLQLDVTMLGIAKELRRRESRGVNTGQYKTEFDSMLTAADRSSYAARVIMKSLNEKVQRRQGAGNSSNARRTADPQHAADANSGNGGTGGKATDEAAGAEEGQDTAEGDKAGSAVDSDPQHWSEVISNLEARLKKGLQNDMPQSGIYIEPRCRVMIMIRHLERSGQDMKEYRARLGDAETTLAQGKRLVAYGRLVALEKELGAHFKNRETSVQAE